MLIFCALPPAERFVKTGREAVKGVVMQSENRESFVFYRSFWDAIREMEEADQLAMFRAICEYALDGKMPALTCAIHRAVFAAVRPSIDTNNARREGGKRGGRPKTKKTTLSHPETIGFEAENLAEEGFSPENQGEQRFSKPENTESESEYESEAESKESSSRTDEALAEIIQEYEQEIGSFPRSALDKLQAYRAEAGDEMVHLAIQEAAQHNGRSWSYLDSVLSTWRKEGVKTPGDLAARRDKMRSRRQPQPQAPEPRYEVLR